MVVTSQDEVADTFGINTRTLQRWMKRGCPGKPRAYKIADIIQWARENVWVKDEVEKPDGEASHRDLLEYEKYREKKRENDEAENLLAPVELLEEALAKSVNVMLPILEMLPMNLKRRWPEMTGEQAQVVKEVVAECRNAMADAEIVIDDT